MEEAHFIEWIEVIDGDNSQKVYLKPADSPKAEFTVSKNESLRIRSYCNLHGLWEKNI
jgi:superoxide reductase